ncbi:MAG: hypothetical protein Fur0010_27070 [Bdellovibrio sp.]
MNSEKLLFTIEDAAKILNLKISRLRTAVFKKEIGYVKLSGLVRFTKENLEEWIKRSQVNAG